MSRYGKLGDMSQWAKPFYQPPPTPADKSLLEQIRDQYPDMFVPGAILPKDPPMTATAIKMAMENAQEEHKKYELKLDPMTFEHSAETMIAMRLRIRTGEMLPFRHLSAYRDETTAVVMVVTPKGEPVMICDDAGLFPSDTLITQLRMLIETGNIKGGVVGAVSGG